MSSSCINNNAHTLYAHTHTHTHTHTQPFDQSINQLINQLINVHLRINQSINVYLNQSVNSLSLCSLTKCACVCVCVCVCVCERERESLCYIVLLPHEMVSTALRALQSTSIFCQTNLSSSAQQPSTTNCMSQLSCCSIVHNTMHTHTHTHTSIN